MAPTFSKLDMQNELLELAYNLRQERLLVTSEKENLQTLNEKVAGAVERLHHLAWQVREHKTNLDMLVLSRPYSGISFSCQRANMLENAMFVKGYKQLGFHETSYGDFFQQLRDNPQLLATCIAVGEKLMPEATPVVINVVVSGLYANCMFQEDEGIFLQLLRQLMELQLVASDNPRRVLRHGSSAFSRMYKTYTEGLFLAKLFLTAALHEPILHLLMEDELYLDIDCTRIGMRFSPDERERRFGREGTPEYTAAMQSYRNFIIERLVTATKRFVNSISSSLSCFPPSVSWLVRELRSLLMNALRIEQREAHAICVDLIFTYFICPAIVDPEPFGISVAPISPVARFNLIQVAQTLQVLALSRLEPIDPRFADLYSQLDKESLCATLDVILEGSSGEGSSGSSSGEVVNDFPPPLQGMQRNSVLVVETELNFFVHFLRTVSRDAPLTQSDKALLDTLLAPLPVCSTPVKAGGCNGEYSPSPPPTPSVRSRVLDRMKSARIKTGTLRFQIEPQQNGSCNNSDDSTDSPTGRLLGNGEVKPEEAGHHQEPVLVISLQNKRQECIGMLSEQQVIALQREKESERTSIDGGSVRGNEEMPTNPIQEKRTRFSLSHDEGSIGNTSDNMEAISEAASNHSVASSVESENEDEAEQDYPIDNLSDMVSANVSGRGSPNVSGRDTPSSQVTEDEGPPRQGNSDRRPLLVSTTMPKPSDIDDRFGRFDVKDMIIGDETRSLVSDSWSTDVMGSDCELLAESAERERAADRPPLEEILLPGRHLLVEPEAGLFDASETASEAWSTDVITSDTERMAEVDTDETNSVARSDTDPGDQDSSSQGAAAAIGPPTVAVSGSGLGLAPRLRARLPAALFRPIREVQDHLRQMQQLSIHSSAAVESPAASIPPHENSSASSSSCSSRCSISSSVSSNTRAFSAAAGRGAASSTASAAAAASQSVASQTPHSSPASTGAIPKSISFDKTADRGDKESAEEDNKVKRGFFRSLKLPFKRGGRKPHAETPDSLGYNRLRRSTSEESRSAPVESTEDILAKYRNKGGAANEISASGGDLGAAGNQSAAAAACEQPMEDEDDDNRLHIDPNNVEASYAFTDAKRKLRMVLSTADLNTLPTLSAASASVTESEHELVVFLKVQLADAINLQDRSLVAKLHETLRCVRLFDKYGCSKLFQALQDEYKRRSPYLSYLIQCRQALLSTLAHLDRLASRVRLDIDTSHRFLISVCVRIFLERRQTFVEEFAHEFQRISLADEKTDYLEAFLGRLIADVDRDPMWNGASQQQLELAATAIEQIIMERIYTHALYPNGDGDISRDQVLYEHIHKLGQVISATHKDLRIPHLYRYECPWPSAQAELVSISAYKTPRDKVACVVRCATTVMQLLSLAAVAAERAVPAADDFIPVFVFVLIKANPPGLLSTVEYVNSFYGKRLAGEEQYWWTQFCSAIEFIKTMDYNC